MLYVEKVFHLPLRAKTFCSSSLVVDSAFCFRSSDPAVTPQLSGSENAAEKGLPVEGFIFCQYSLRALQN